MFLAGFVRSCHFHQASSSPEPRTNASAAWQGGNGSSNAYRYAGEYGYYRDSAAVQYVRARYLNVVQGRWMSAAPLRFEAGDYNLYRYVGNEPVGRMDASGLQRGGPVIEVPVPCSHVPRGSISWVGSLCIIGGGIEACYEICTYRPGHPSVPLTSLGEYIGKCLFPCNGEIQAPKCPPCPPDEKQLDKVPPSDPHFDKSHNAC